MNCLTRPAYVMVALLALGGLPSCRHPEEPQTSEQVPIAVRVVPVRVGAIADVLTVTGETAALATLRLASPVAGRVTMLNVRPGDRLAANEVAARVMPLENEAALHGLALLEDNGPDKDKGAARQLRKDLGRRDIALRAPFPAVVAERRHNPGEQVTPSDELLELFDPQSLYVQAEVPDESAPRLGIGMDVEVLVQGTAVTGHVSALGGALVPQSLTLPVRISLSAPLQSPVLHAAVECRIIVARHSAALLVPRSALVSSTMEDHGAVMVADGDRARQRAISIGLRAADDIEVTDGVRAGELVLVTGQYALPDGTRIRPVRGTSE